MLLSLVEVVGGMVMKWGKILNFFSLEELNFIKNMPSNCEYEKALTVVGRVYAEKLDVMGKCVREGKKDKSGNNETFHLQSVSDKASSTEGRIVGLLHDIVEDKYIDLGDLLLLGFSPLIVSTINLLTRDKSVYPNYSDYITSIIESGNFIAIETKFNDMCNNLCVRRIFDLPEWRQDKLIKKYCKELPRLAKAYTKIQMQELVRKRRISI